ncbi:carbohydrate ABC transporter permease [Bifidobacterium vespertilionis]|uniref:Maltose/maltodextrin transport system permease protein n=1 Tax=Bifidobacterium vespertilionis TaxID=2562524 RepID=A0A5J5DZZ6_9BIFI|nr:sugar ABC transporter permease [Bifidobacterium vespertilionis]KAA8818048.1 sugar ABC transporter permease [Bifidobacterium vespertilionis]KAA8822300.1 sugar ABC transporter permease [Bifidobacterium vespertilionis]
MTASVSAKPVARRRSRAKSGFAPSPYILREALAKGDVLTRLSAVVFGLGNIARKQYLKGLIYLAGEIGFIVFMVRSGATNLSKLPSLGDVEQRKVKINGFWKYEAGDNSVVILLYGVATVCIIILFLMWWRLSVTSAYKAQVLAKSEGRAPTLSAELHDLLDGNIQRTLMFLPTVGIAVFTVLPLIFMISMAFTNYDSNHVTLFDWVGLENFKLLFSSNSGADISLSTFGSVLGWTLIWAFFATFLNFFLGMFMAMIINRRTTRFKGFWRAIFSLSIAVPQFVSLLVMRTMLQPTGAINRLLMEWGWTTGPLPFFTDATWARVTVIVINLWVGIPFTIMQITGILQNVPAELYEASKVDGANWWQTFTHVTMPYIIFVLTPYLITTFTGNVNNFNVIYLLSGGDPTPVGATAGKTDLLITWLYKLTVDRNNYNLGAVIGILTFVVLAVVSLITYRNSGSYKNEEGFR